MVAMVLSFAACSSARIQTNEPSNQATEPTKQTNIKEVKLDDSILQQAIEDCKNKTSWGINLGKVASNYRTGWKLSAWIVLHNDSQTEKMVTITAIPLDQGFQDKSLTNINYEPTPANFNPEWVTIGEKQIRLAKSETKAVVISLLVPESEKFEAENWAFRVNADGQSINQGQQVSKVTTTPDDNGILELTLAHPLISDNIASIKGVKSEIDENLKVTNYDSINNKLTIEGFKQGQVRNITVNYEYGSMFTEARDQLWLLTIL
jgi:hypothetical protein